MGIGVRSVHFSKKSKPIPCIQDPGRLGWGGASCRPARNKMTQNIQQCPHSSPLFRLMITCPLVQLHICTLRVKLFLFRYLEFKSMLKCSRCSNVGPQSAVKSINRIFISNVYCVTTQHPERSISWPASASTPSNEDI